MVWEDSMARLAGARFQGVGYLAGHGGGQHGDSSDVVLLGLALDEHAGCFGLFGVLCRC